MLGERPYVTIYPFYPAHNHRAANLLTFTLHCIPISTYISYLYDFRLFIKKIKVYTHTNPSAPKLNYCTQIPNHQVVFFFTSKIRGATRTIDIKNCTYIQGGKSE